MPNPVYIETTVSVALWPEIRDAIRSGGSEVSISLRDGRTLKMYAPRILKEATCIETRHVRFRLGGFDAPETPKENMRNNEARSVDCQDCGASIIFLNGAALLCQGCYHQPMLQSARHYMQARPPLPKPGWFVRTWNWLRAFWG